MGSEMEFAKTFVLPDSLCKNVGIGAKLLPGDKIGAFAFNPQSKNVEKKDVKVHMLRRDVILFDPITRKLINESNGTFLAGQKLAGKASQNEIRSELLKLSRQYRSIIRACLEDLQTEAGSSDPKRKEVCLHLVTVFYNVEFLWHLSEILFVDVIPGDIVLPHLLEWVRFHYFHSERQAAALLETSTDTGGIELQPKYWDTVIGLILQGKIDAARALLKFHSSAQGEAFQASDYLLRSMPVYSVYSGLSLAEFSTRWKCWQNEVQAKINSGIFASRDELELIMKIIVGNAEAFAQVRDQCGTWYQYMIAWLLYTEPTVKTFDLSFHASKAILAFGQTSLREVDMVIIAILELNLKQMVRHISTTTENGWFAAHLVNLFYLCATHTLEENLQRKITSGLHEQLLMEYGTLLMSHHSLWQVGISYLDHCGAQGQACMELLLPRVPIKTESKALRVIQVARNRGMDEVVLSVSKVMAMRWFKLGRLGSALTWALRSRDAKASSYLADQFLQQYCSNGTFSIQDLLENLGSSMLLSDRLTFLGKYCEFHQLYRDQHFRDAASLLSALMISNLAPKYFWLSLLLDAVPLLESNELVFNSKETYELIQCLEEFLIYKGIVNLSSKAKEQSEQKSLKDSSLYENISLIRLALARNLARALSSESCVKDKKNVIE